LLTYLNYEGEIMTESRNDKPGFNTPPDFFDKELTDKEIAEGVESFWTNAEAGLAAQVNLECAIDSIMQNESEFELLFIEIKNAVNNGKLPTLKKHMDKYIECEIEAGNGDWL